MKTNIVHAALFGVPIGDALGVPVAVNMRNDSDTTAAVTGGLAGLYYGFDSIPEKWVTEIKKSVYVKDLCDRLTKAMGL